MNSQQRIASVLVTLLVGVFSGVAGGFVYDDLRTDPYERERATWLEAEKRAELRSRGLEGSLARAERAQQLAEREWTEAVAALVEMRGERDALAAQLDQDAPDAQVRALRAECDQLRKVIEALRGDLERLRER